MRKLLLPILFLLASAPCWATWGLVQHPSNTSCSGTSCSVTTTSTGSGHAIVVVAWMGTSSAITISTVTGGGTFTHCSACHVADSSGLAVDASFTCSSTSGTTSISIGLSSTVSSWAAEIIEYSYTSGCAIDTQGTRDQSSNSANPAGVTLTLTGTNDVIVQFINGSNSASAISGSYTNPADFPGGDGAGGAMNTTSGTAPTWTMTSGKAALGAIALEETGGASPAPGTDKRQKLELIDPSS